MKHGFSLVELSIVLVILGLLVGGILAGQSLIRASELRAVTSEAGRWVTSTQAFRDKYLGLPGDMTNAQSFWGVASSGCTNNNPMSATGTCNGNGDTKVTWCSNVAASDYSCKEVYWYWQHLALSGLIEGTYKGSGVYNPVNSIVGINIPGSRMSGGNWAVDNANYIGIGNNNVFSIDYGNALTFGGLVLSATDAWNIDKKIDDGMPAAGRVVRGWDGKYWWDANTCTTAANSMQLSATYSINNSSAQCNLSFIKAF